VASTVSYVYLGAVPKTELYRNATNDYN